MVSHDGHEASVGARAMPLVSMIGVGLRVSDGEDRRIRGDLLTMGEHTGNHGMRDECMVKWGGM